jgi:hypothetical protein
MNKTHPFSTAMCAGFSRAGSRRWFALHIWRSTTVRRVLVCVPAQKPGHIGSSWGAAAVHAQ